MIFFFRANGEDMKELVSAIEPPILRYKNDITLGGLGHSRLNPE